MYHSFGGFQYKLFGLLLLLIASQSVTAKNYPSPSKHLNQLYHLQDFVHLIENEKIATSFSSFGTFGNPIVNISFDTTGPGFKMVDDPDKEYLFGGAVWIGGIIGQDTLVSFSFSGWDYSALQFTPQFWDEHGSLSQFQYNDFLGYRTEFSDTNVYPSASTLPEFVPLNTRVALRAFLSPSDSTNDIVLYDMTITNLNTEIIEDMYVGMYLDGDVGYTGEASYYQDDFTGSIRSHGIGYIMDNDGDLSQPDSLQVPHALALKLCYTSHPVADTNFNWWFSSVSSEYDFGPRLKGTPEDPYHDFNTGGTGTPIGDTNKYYILSHKEWDYETPLISTITEDDPLWMLPPQPLTFEFATGYDARILLSFGPVTLQPDSSVRYVIATYFGDSLHISEDNINLLPEQPMEYLNRLNYDNIILDGLLADSLAALLVDPQNPVIGLQIEHQSNDSVSIEWDPAMVPYSNGYTLYLSEVPSSWIPYPGVAPPWLTPFYYNWYEDLPEITNYTLDNLDRDKFYFVNVANRTITDAGNPGEPLIVSMRNRNPEPVIPLDYAFYYGNEPITFSWTLPTGNNIKHANIYKFESIQQYLSRYHAFYSKNLEMDKEISDIFYTEDGIYYYYSLTPFAVLDGSSTSFTDNVTDTNIVYSITFVDSAGFESEFSTPIQIQLMPEKTKDLLVMTSSFISSQSFTVPDSIISFYETLLDGYSYDIYSVFDSAEVYDCYIDTLQCFDLHDIAQYNYIIIDDDAREKILQCETEVYTNVFTRYILSGGTLIYFGNFSHLYNFGFNSATRFYPNTNSFTRRFFGFDSVYFYPFTCYYTLTEPPYIDSLYGFSSAVSIMEEMPSLTYDSSRHPLVNLESMTQQLWPSGTPPSVGAFTASDNTEITHLFNSTHPSTSILHNYPVGIKTDVGNGSTYLFGFHLWYMMYDNARQLLATILQHVSTDVTDQVNSDLLPDRLTLRQNYPNPFNPNTTISFELPRKSHITLEIYNILGQKVISLISDETFPAGVHAIEWDGKTNSNQTAASGIYLYRLIANDHVISKKMMLLK